MDGMFDGLGLEVVGDVLDDPCAGAAGAVQLAAAIRASRQLMGFVAVDAVGPGPGVSRVAVLAAAFLPPLPGLRLGVGRQRSGRSVCSAGRARTASHDSAQLQQQEDDGGAIARQGALGLCFGQRAGAKGGEELRIESGSRCHHGAEKLP
jgi:hypothetical protein